MVNTNTERSDPCGEETAQDGGGEQPRPLARLTLFSADSQFSVSCDALAVGFERFGHPASLKLLSVAGPGTAIKAIAAALHGAGKDVRFRVCDCENIDEYNWLLPVGKWEAYRTHLGLGTYQLVAWSRDEGFLATVSHEAIRRELLSPRVTTPLLTTPEWIDYIVERLKAKRCWTDYTCFGCKCAGISLDSETVDQIVTDGVRSGVLCFTQEELCKQKT